MATVIATQTQTQMFPAPASSSSSFASPHRASYTSITEEHQLLAHAPHPHVRPAKNIEAFNSLLPPAVEFVEGSSTGVLAVPEGKYEPINTSPKPSHATVVMNGKQKSAPSGLTKSRSHEARESRETRSLYNQALEFAWPPDISVGAGFYNNGNTCFVNSALQCLLHTPPLLRILAAHSKDDTCRVKPGTFCMCCSLRQVMLDSFSKSRTFSPLPITKNMHLIAKHLRKGRQEDSHEFLRYAIDALQKACLAGQPSKVDHKLAETTWVHKLFGGRLRSRVTCTQCGHNSDTFDSILDLSIDIYGSNALKDALKKFTAIDHLKGADKYKCEKCKRPVNAEKQFTIHDAPPVLTVHLKRFTPMGRKLAHPIRYDERLNLQPSMSEGQFGPSYQLYAVISHAGSGPNSGHYYAHVKAPNGQWYEMNDDLVERIKGAPVNMKNAYILFYMREKGQSLEAALNSRPPHHNALSRSSNEPNVLVNGHSSAPRKRKVVLSDDESDGDKGEKVEPQSITATKPFIGPEIPPHLQRSAQEPRSTPTSPVSPSSKPHPQTEFLKKKIEAVEREKERKERKLTKPPPGPLVEYDSNEDDADSASGKSADKAAAKRTEEASLLQPSSAPSVVSRFKEGLSSPAQPPLSSLPSSPSSSPTSTAIPADSFYADIPKKSKVNGDQPKKRKSPDRDVDMEDAARVSATSLQHASSKSSGGGDAMRTSTSTLSSTSRGPPLSFGTNPYSRIRGNSMDSSREEVMFRPRKLMKQQYGKKKKMMF